MSRTPQKPPSFTLALQSSMTHFEHLVDALATARQRLKEMREDAPERSELEGECARISEEILRVLLAAHRKSHPADIAAMVKVATVRAGIKQTELPRGTPVPAVQVTDALGVTREAILREIQVLTEKLKKGTNERQRACKRIADVVREWFDAGFPANDLRLVKAVIPFKDYLPNGKRFKTFRANVREEADPMTQPSLEEVPSDALPENWAWHAYLRGKRVLAFVGGTVTDARRTEVIEYFGLDSLEIVVLGREKATRRLQSLNTSLAGGAYDVAFLPKEFSGETSRHTLDACRAAGVTIVRLTWGTSVAQIQRAIENQISKPSPKEARRAS